MSLDKKNVLLEGSLLIIESLARAGADVFIGYPITPANLLYLYASRRFPVALAAPDEITTLQWMSGFAAAGKIPVTATSFPGFALMVETQQYVVWDDRWSTQRFNPSGFQNAQCDGWYL